MKYCIECGGKLSDGANYCPECGMRASESACGGEYGQAYRESTVKCSRCGENLDAFASACPSCGYELRGVATLSRVRELEKALGEISSTSKRSEMIKDFYIPNTKEDVYEFFILASSNLKAGGSDEEAWMAKLEQARQKAELVLEPGKELDRLTKICSSCRKRYHKKRGVFAIMSGLATSSKTMQALIAFVALALLGMLIMLYGKAIDEPLYDLIGMFPFMGGFYFLIGIFGND